MYKKRWNGIITCIMLAIGFAVIGYSLMTYCTYNYPEQQSKKVLSYDTDNVYKIDTYLMLGLPDLDNMKLIIEFCSSLGQIDGVKANGAYYLQEDYVTGIGKLYMSSSITSLCNLKDSDGRTINLESQDSNKGIAAVGVNLADEYPVGSIYYDVDSECEYLISAIISEESSWLADQLNDETTIVLDDVIVLDLDTFMENGNLYLFMNAVTNMYFVADSDAVCDEVYKMADEMGLKLNGIHSLKQIFKINAADAMYYANEVYLMPAILFVASLVAIWISIMMTMIVNKQDIGIMLSNGMTRLNIVMMIICENIIKCIFAFLLSAIYWKIQYNKMIDLMKTIYHDVWGVRVSLLLFTIIIASILPSLYIIRKKPYTLMMTSEL